MSPDMQAAGRFLTVLENVVTRIDDWGYSLALRFEAYDRANGEARMLRGGHFSVSCGFAIDRQTHRWLTFAVSITQEVEQWLVVVTAEDEDEGRSYFHWVSPSMAASSLDSLAETLDRAFVILDESLQLPEVGAAFAAIRRKKNA